MLCSCAPLRPTPPVYLAHLGLTGHGWAGTARSPSTQTSSHCEGQWNTRACEWLCQRVNRDSVTFQFIFQSSTGQGGGLCALLSFLLFDLVGRGPQDSFTPTLRCERPSTPAEEKLVGLGDLCCSTLAPGPGSTRSSLEMQPLGPLPHPLNRSSISPGFWGGCVHLKV